MIIIINGSRNAGKSTVAKLLAKQLANSAHIEIDALRWFLPSRNLEQSIPVNLENAVLLSKNLVKKKFNVILDYCLRKKDYKYLIKKLKKSVKKIHTFTLKPKLSVALSNKGRKLSADDKKRIRQQYSRTGQHKIPLFGTIIDNSKFSSDKVASFIFKLITNK